MSEPLEAPSPQEDALPGLARALLAALLLLYVVLGLVYIRENPWAGGLDEQLHYNYVRVLVEEKRLPWLYQDMGKWVRYREAHALHPPLYHLAMAPVYLALRNNEALARNGLRLATLGMGVLTVVMTFRILLRAFGGWQEALAATAFFALMPHTLLISTVVNNDIGSLLAYSTLLYLGAVRWQGAITWLRAIVLGVVAGLAGLTKGTCEVACFPMGLYLASAGGPVTSRSDRLTRAGLFLAVALFLVAPWHARNLRLYGSLSFMPDDGPNPFLPQQESLLVQIMHDNFLPVLAFAARWQINTLWSQKDWIPEDLRPLIYGAFLWFVVLGGIAGLLASRKGRVRGSPIIWRAWGISALALWAMALFIACFKHFGWVEGGRYLLTLLPAVGAAALSGLWWIPPERRVERLFGFAAVVAGLLALNTLCVQHLVTVLVPMYHSSS